MTAEPTPLLHLGQASALPETPDTATLDRVPNPHPDTPYVARFTVPEFTS
ncbi:MAG TPA: NADPH-dependent 7-cyano-7-deazaguanine reductase QueF, partial [Hyphomicrobiaceae bacterium]|nr:NADPH-dependent 7-cyano-7-deazaguanine reductase QueF [Hyphomicrobiaceae bacterium]